MRIRLDFRRFHESGLRSSEVIAGSFPEQRLVIEPTCVRILYTMIKNLKRDLYGDRTKDGR